jgi:hypothetical protein
MPALSDYVTGSITLTNGSAAFSGNATGWLLAGFKEGDTILDVAGASGRVGVIASINSNTAGMLSKAWEGPTLINVAYRMRYQPDGARVSAQARNLIEVLGSGNLQSLAGLEGMADQVPVFTGPSTMELVPKSDLGPDITPFWEERLAQDGTAAAALAGLRAASNVPNLCHNGALQVWQQLINPVPNMGHRVPLADGFLFGNNSNAGPGRFTGSRDTDVPSQKAAASIRLDCTTAEASLTSTSDAHVRYALLGSKVFPHWDTALKVSFRAKTNKPGKYSLIANNEARSHCYVAEYEMTGAGAWEDVEVAIPLSQRLGTWNDGNGYGIGLRWSFLAGASLRTSALGWQAGNFVGGPNQVNLADTVGNYFKLAEIGIHPNVVPTFEPAPYESALTESFRQYRVVDTDVAGVNFTGVGAPSNTVNFDLPLSPPMYAPPVIGLGNSSLADFLLQDGAGVSKAITGLTAFNRSKHFAKFTLSSSDTITAGAIYQLRMATTAAKLVFSGYLP